MKVNYKIKRNRFGTLIILIPIILIAFAELFAIMSSRETESYIITSLTTAEVLSEVCIALLIVAYVLSFHIKGRIYSIVFDVVRLAVAAMLCWCVYTILSERAELMGYVWFSDLESNNQLAVNALNYGVVSAVLYVVGIVALAASSVVEFVNAGVARRSREEVESEIRELQAELAAIDNA